VHTRPPLPVGLTDQSHFNPIRSRRHRFGTRRRKPASESRQPERQTFTRSELRVLEEETKNKEEEVRDLIQQFDANLDNPEGRRLAEDALQKVLPEYKKNMLAVGKEKLNSLRQNQ
jgi:hypothetical protein